MAMVEATRTECCEVVIFFKEIGQGAKSVVDSPCNGLRAVTFSNKS